jgi:hypothetical protein
VDSIQIQLPQFMPIQENLRNVDQREGTVSSLRGAAGVVPTVKNGKASSIIVLGTILLAISSARANIIVDATQTGADVNFTVSGSVDTSSLMMIQDATAGSEGLLYALGVQFPSATGLISMYYLPNLVVTPSNPFTSVSTSHTSQGGGTPFMFTPTEMELNHLCLPASYTSGDPLANTMTFTNTTFQSLGLMPGTYVWSWSNDTDSGPVSDKLTLNIGQSVPDTGSTLLLMGIGLSCIVMLRRKIAAEGGGQPIDTF